MKRIFLIPVFLMLSFGLFASDLNRLKGTDQEVIVKLIPRPAQTDVPRYTAIEVIFSVPLGSGCLKKHNIKLQRLSSQANGMISKLKSHFLKSDRCIQGRVDYAKAEQRLIFTPLKPLEPGMYEVEIKNLKTDKAHKATKIKQIRYRFIVVKELLESITIIPGTVDVKEGSTVQLQALGHYDNGSDRNLTSHVKWSVRDPETAEVDAHGALSTHKEGVTILRASLNNIEGDASVVVYKELHGYRLPPEPDPAINNATLLGIDSNNNGVRDDVERLVVLEEAKNREYSKIQIAIGLQFAWAWQKMIEKPSLESDKYLARASACQRYFFSKKTNKMKGYAKRREWRKQHYGILGNALEDKIFNTKERIERRFEFLEACSNNIFNLLPAELKACQKNIDELGE